MTTVVIGSCPNGCQGFEMETEGPDSNVDAYIERLKETFGECSDCGADIGFLRQDEQSEVLD